MTYLFISHNMAVITYMSSRIGVLYKGEMVELGQKNDIFNNPENEYTKKLISSIIV